MDNNPKIDILGCTDFAQTYTTDQVNTLNKNLASEVWYSADLLNLDWILHPKSSLIL